jgi:hypothetical protein
MRRAYVFNGDWWLLVSSHGDFRRRRFYERARGIVNETLRNEVDHLRQHLIKQAGKHPVLRGAASEDRSSRPWRAQSP